MEPIFDASAPVYVVGGGPSLHALDWAKLEGRQAVAVNLAYRRLPRACVLFFADDRFYRQHRDAGDPAQDFRRFAGRHVFTTAPCLRDRPHPRIRWVDPATLAAAGVSAARCNSGVQAAVLALMLGAADVRLLGFDNAPGHWADGLPWAHSWRVDPAAYRTYADQLETLLAAEPRITRRDAASDPDLFHSAP